MKGRYFAIYDLKQNEQCRGIFESIEEVCNFFGGISQDRVMHAIHRKMPLAFKTERFEVISFAEATKHEIRLKLRTTFGKGMFQITRNGIYVRYRGIKGWQLIANDYEGALPYCR